MKHYPLDYRTKLELQVHELLVLEYVALTRHVQVSAEYVELAGHAMHDAFVYKTKLALHVHELFVLE